MIHPDQVNFGEFKVRTLFDCPAGINIGDPVYQTGANAVDLADCTDPTNKIPAVGIVSSKPTSTTCYVVSQGKVEKLGWSLVPKETYFVGAGTGIVPGSGLPPGPGIAVQEVGYAKSADVLMAQVDRDWSTA